MHRKGLLLVLFAGSFVVTPCLKRIVWLFIGKLRMGAGDRFCSSLPCKLPLNDLIGRNIFRYVSGESSQDWLWLPMICPRRMGLITAHCGDGGMTLCDRDK